MTDRLSIASARLSGESADLVDIIVSGGLIERIVPSAMAGSAADIDASGRTVVPGLIDAHVHLSFTPDTHPEEQLAQCDDETLRGIVLANARESLSHGVTTLRDLGSRRSVVRDLALDISRGIVTGPRILASGPVITRAQGHCHFVGDAIDDARPVAEVVAEHAQAGDSWLKIMVTGGALTSTSSPETLQFAHGEVAELVRLAHIAGLRVAAHALTAEGASVAVGAGADSIEHGVDIRDETLAELARAGGFLVPVLTPSARTLARDPAGRGEHASRLRVIVDRLHDSTRRALLGETRVIAGTDAGCPDVPHGSSLVEELALLESLGMSRERALRAATMDAALALGLTDTDGIRQGARADLLLVSGDPAESISFLRAPEVILAAGRVVPVPLAR